VIALIQEKVTMTWVWSRLNQSPGNYASAMWLMQDGSVLANLYGGTKLMALYPDSAGSYVNGAWVDAGDFLLAKANFSSAVLSDGRLIACGGEQTGPQLQQTESNFCEIYDPRTGSSTPISPPPGWTNIGDSPSVVLSDGTFMLGNTQGRGDQVALLNPATLTWTFGGGDSDNEQGYTLLQTGDVLTTGVYAPTSKRYDPAAQAFAIDAPLPVMLGAGSEIGPGLTLMDGRVAWFGANGHTCVYTPGGGGGAGSWAQASDMPVLNGDQLATNDSCAILEPNGRVFLVSWGANSGVVFLEYDPAADSFAVVTGGPQTGNREGIKMLLLPDGHGLVSAPLDNGDAAWYEVTFSPGGDASWAPGITSFPATVETNTTVILEGTQLCGLSECQSFGDDNQQAEHYPMVRFVSASGEVRYARAHDVSTRSIAPSQKATVSVDIPSNLAPGTYCVQVVAMGIPSPDPCVSVEVRLPLSVLIKGIVALLFGGVARDGGGWFVIKGVRVPVDPGPLLRAFTGLSQEIQDALIGQSIERMASFLNNAAAGRAIREIVLGLQRGQQRPGEDQKPPQRGSSGGRLAQNVLVFALGVALGVLAALLVSRLL
jgi:hypothetical protein